MRKVLGKGAALIPSSKKRGGPGVALDIPLGHKDAAFVRSHFDGMEVRINDAPRANEIMVAVAVTDSGRPHPRVGGLTKERDQGRRRAALDPGDALADRMRDIQSEASNMKMFSAFVSASSSSRASRAQARRRARRTRSRSARSTPTPACPPSPSPIARAGSSRSTRSTPAGGVNGKKLEVISKDDGGKPADAVTAANELVASDGVVDARGNVLLQHRPRRVAISPSRRKFCSSPAEPLTDAITLSKGNRYTFRLRPVQLRAGGDARRRGGQAAGQEMGDDRAQLRIRPVRRRRVQEAAVGRSGPTSNGSASNGRRRARSTPAPWREAIAKTEPEAILNVTFGPDLVKLVREGNTRGLFKDRSVVSFLTGEPEYLDPLKDETPEGWIVTGYPWDNVAIPEHAAFLKAYQAKYNDYPRLGSVVGYAMIKAAAAILAKADSTDTREADRRRGGHRGRARRSAPITFRAIDHQSTLGAFVGKTALKDGKGVMVDVDLSRRRRLSAVRGRGQGLRPKD